MKPRQNEQEKKTGLVMPNTSLNFRLQYIINNNKVIPRGIRSQLGIEILRADPEERTRNNITIFASIPDDSLRSTFPTDVLNYHIFFTVVHKSKITDEQTCRVLELSRLEFLSSYLEGNLNSGNMPRDQLQTIDQMVSENCQPIEHPVLHLKLLRTIMKSCDAQLRALKNNPANILSGGGITRQTERETSSKLEFWNGLKHKAVGKYLQYAMLVEDMYDLENTFDYTTKNPEGDILHKQIEIKPVDINNSIVLLKKLGLPTEQDPDETIRVTNDPIYTTINISLIAKKIKDAARRNSNTVSNEERWLAEYFK